MNPLKAVRGRRGASSSADPAAERDYYRQVAERLGRKALTDAQDHARLVASLRATEAELRRGRELLEQEIAGRTAELMRANRELVLTKARYDELVQRIPHGVYTLHAAADGTLRFEYVSPQLCAMMGCDADAALSDADHVLRGVHPDDLPGLYRCSAEAAVAGGHFDWEGRYLVGGEERWIRLEADPTCLPGGDILWAGVASDVSDRRRAQDLLRESEEMYRQLNELAPNPITVAGLDGTIRIANPPALLLFGHVDEAELVGRSVFEWVAPQSRATAQSAFAAVFHSERPMFVELDLVRADGSVFAGEAGASLVRDAQGMPQHVIVITRDLTQRHQLEMERLRLQKLEAVGTLAGGLAHDFNNLLQGVFGYISLARLKLHDPAEATAMLARAELATGQAVNLTSQLLTFAKGGQPRKQRLSLPAVVEGAAGFALSGTATVFALQVAPGLWDADADEGQVVQVIQNIVMNASQAMQRAGTVSIDLDNRVVTPGVDEALPDGGEFVALRIADQGVGIPPAILTRIFDPYFTTKERGSGLGLATAWSIIKRHGGTVRVASQPGAGTIFEVLLPAAVATEAPSEQPAPRGGADCPTRRGRVLVMDDEEMVRSVAVALVESLGQEVEQAGDGAEAVRLVEQARAAGRSYDMVILDLTVRGGMGGEEAIGRIRALTPDVRAIVSSGYSDSAVVADFRAHGFDAYLNKPYTIEALRETMAALLAD